MFGTLSDRLRKWLGVSPWPPENNAAANARPMPEPPETAGSSGNSANEPTNKGSATEAVVSSDCISQTAEPARRMEALKEAPGVNEARRLAERELQGH